MTNANLFNKLLNDYNKHEAMVLLINELGASTFEYEMEKRGEETLTFEVFFDIAQEWSFFEDYITDENWDKFKGGIQYPTKVV